MKALTIAREQGPAQLTRRIAGRFARGVEDVLKGSARCALADAAGMLALRAPCAPSVLVVDEHAPFFDRDAGSRRIAHLLEALEARGAGVVFGSLDRDSYGRYGRRLREAGVCLLTGFTACAPRALATLGAPIDVIWLSRPSSAGACLDAARAAYPRACILYDTVDLHYRRLEREERVTGKPTGGHAMRELELGLARRADITIAVSEPEAAELVREGVRSVERFGVFETPAAFVAPWEARSGAIFVGNYGHAPNVDAARVLIERIVPLVRERLREFEAEAVGCDPPSALRASAGAGVLISGYVGDINAALGCRRVFAAPLRFGAGLKGKIVQALANGLPVVTSSVGAEGIPDASSWGIIADDEVAFASAVVTLHADRALWERLSAGARRAARGYAPAAAALQLEAILARCDALRSLR